MGASVEDEPVPGSVRATFPYRIELRDDLVAFIADTGDATMSRGSLRSQGHAPVRPHDSPRAGATRPAVSARVPIPSQLPCTGISRTGACSPARPPWNCPSRPSSTRRPARRSCVHQGRAPAMVGIGSPPTSGWPMALESSWVRTAVRASRRSMEGGRRAPGRPAPDDPPILAFARPTALPAGRRPGGRGGRRRFSFGEPSAPIPEWPSDGALILDERCRMGGRQASCASG